MELSAASLDNDNSFPGATSLAVLNSIEACANGFGYKEFIDDLINRSGTRDAGINGISLLCECIEALYYQGRGDRVETIIGERL